jgi:nitroreductase
MNVFEAIRTRRSVRRYKTHPVEENKLQRILEAGRLSPSAVNKQPWHFIVVRDPSVRESLRASYGQSWFVNAPLIIVVCADPSNAWVRRDGEEYWKVDAAIALQDMILCATEEGLGTCWIGAFNEEPARRVLKIPEKIRIVAMTPLGYADESKAPVSDRKPLKESCTMTVGKSMLI